MAARRHDLKTTANTLFVKKAQKLLSAHPCLLHSQAALWSTFFNMLVALLTGTLLLRFTNAPIWTLIPATTVLALFIWLINENMARAVGNCYTKNVILPASFLLVLFAPVTLPLIRLVDWLTLNAFSHSHPFENKKTDHSIVSIDEQKSSQHDSEHKHQTILENLSALEDVVVEDIMTPRRNMETLNLSASFTELNQQIVTCYHSRLPVFEEDPNNIIGILSLKRLLPAIAESSFNHDMLRNALTKPYFIPANTPVYTQLQFFQENHQRLGLVVDEYGEIQGLITLEDIVEELIGKFTTSTLNTSPPLKWSDDGSVIVDGMQTLRDLNRALNIDFPLDGPRTLNGLILEHLQDIPETGLSIKIGKVPIEVLQTEDRRIKTVRLFLPVSDL